MSLIEYVKSLEGKANRDRGKQVMAALDGLGIETRVQSCLWPRIRNIIVDFSEAPDTKHLLFSAHYDAARGSPGANDNASGVAVLLGLCRELKDTKAPVRVVFFDREEAWFKTPLINLGLLGSQYYVLTGGMKHAAAVYNLEYCGLGDFLAVWPVKPPQQELISVRSVKKAAARLSLDLEFAHIPWPFITSDHLSFRLGGLREATTLSLLPRSEKDALKNLVTGLSLRRFLPGQRPRLPQPLASIHTANDSSSLLNEGSLKLMLSLLLELVRDFSHVS